MTLLHTGATKKYSDNWAEAFGGKSATPSAAKKSAKPKATAKAKTPKKKAASRKK